MGGHRLFGMHEDEKVNERRSSGIGKACGEIVEFNAEPNCAVIRGGGILWNGKGIISRNGS